MSRVEDAARRLEIDLDPDRARSLDVTVTSIENALAWPPWDENASFPPWPFTVGGSEAIAPPQRGSERSVPRRLAAEGGPYVALLEERGASGGPLAGWTVAVKDLISVAGSPLRASSKVRDAAPTQASDASIAEGLRRAGASIVGITAMHEFAFGVTGLNAHTGTPTNPRSPGCIPGGSSSGSAAAVADGSARIALGTDTGGSVRIPAALCGVVGYKPGFGLYPTHGVFPLAPTLDHLGLIAGRVADVRTVHVALGLAAGPAVRPQRLGIDEAALEAADGDVADAVGAVVRHIERDGIEVVPFRWPEREAVFAVSTVIMFAEAAAVHRSTLEENADAYGEDVRTRIIQGSAIRAHAYVAARRQRARIRRSAFRLLGEFDGVISPTVGMRAPTLDAAGSSSELPSRLVEFTRLANVTGIPALSIPIPGDGAPIGLQLTAADDSLLLSVGVHLERLLGDGSG